ncbi:MAG TPA: phosphatase PAP2 family protein [Chloroflexota bacterium]|nr:phosphatase PAP2 family protein [Chloroflexota bacterium]
MTRESGRPPAQENERVERILTEELASVETPEAAERVVGRIEHLSSGATEAERGERAARAPGGAADQVESAAQTTAGPDCTAAVLTEAAAQVAAPNEQAAPAAQAAGTALPPGYEAPTPEAERGRRLLRDAMLRRMGPLQRLDTRLFIAVNTLPHPTWANVLADGITLITTGGWIWLLGLALARILGVSGSRRAFRLAAPSVIGATSAVEWPIKALFRRRRPFIDVVRALVIGRRPDGWSFPSGHTAAAFSGAYVLSTIWPRKSPIFFVLASTVGFSRIYVGAHYPGDVFSGATLGMVIAEAIRRPVSRVIR